MLNDIEKSKSVKVLIRFWRLEIVWGGGRSLGIWHDAESATVFIGPIIVGVSLGRHKTNG